MRAFSCLYDDLHASSDPAVQGAALQRYFAQASGDDAAWAVALLCGRKPPLLLTLALLREAACRMAGIDDWLFEACHQTVGELAETIALVLPAPQAEAAPSGLACWMSERLPLLQGLPQAEQAQQMQRLWRGLSSSERLLLVKIVSGGFRGVGGPLLVQRALALHTGLPAALLAQRLLGWADARSMPSAARWQALVAPADSMDAPAGQPYPFFQAHALQANPATLGPISDWLLEWKFDSQRAQVIKRGGRVWVWSRGEELLSERLPEVVAQAAPLPEGTVLDGVLLVWPPGSKQPAPVSMLQSRLQRKTVSRKVLGPAPVAFMAHDLLEHKGVDIRSLGQQARRTALQALLAPFLGPVLRLSPLLECNSWAAAAALRNEARARGFEGLMIKSAGAGRWWTWKLQALTAKVVLVQAQAGQGRSAGAFAEYGFAIWSRPPASAEETQAVLAAITRGEAAPRLASGALQLLPFAKACSGFSAQELKAVDQVVRTTTLQKFGPVRSLLPTLVVEIGFAGLDTSPRHKSGVVVREPHLQRLRSDMALHEADSLVTLRPFISGG